MTTSISRPAYASVESNKARQQLMYNEVSRAVMASESPLYYHVGTIDMIDYYVPNDESWGCTIAMCHETGVAVNTGFYGMEDFQPVGEFKSDYQIEPEETDGKLTHIFRKAA